MNRQDLYREVQEMLGRVPEWLKRMPDEVVFSFWSLYRGFDLSETVIPNKYKELIGLAVSGATRCKYCTFFHQRPNRSTTRPTSAKSRGRPLQQPRA